MFGRMAVEQGLCTDGELRRSMEELQSRRKISPVSLPELMVNLGYITPTQADRLKGSLKETKAAAVPQQIPGYKIIGKLGAGAMAIVYKAQQLSLNRTVAIKILPKRFTENPEYVSRFYKEGQAAGKLNHPNIVQAVDVGEAGGYHYFVMEYVEGRTIYDDLAAGKIFSEDEALDIIIQVAKALAHAHSCGLIHRDVKPKNIMINTAGVVKLADMGLGYFKPITNRRNISVEKGTLSTKGNLEYAPQITIVNLKNLEIKGVDVDYLHLPQTVAVEQERVQQAAETAKKLSNVPTSKIKIEILKIKGSSFGYVNKTSNPNYRLFIDHAEATLKNFSNQFADGPATLELKGKFMGSGETSVTGTFRPETKNPDFNLNIAIDNTEMTAMNDLFRSYGNFDIKAGLFSFYSEMTIKGDTVKGYVKPLFKDLKVHDQRTDTQKGLFHKLYLGVVNDLSKILENRPRGEVATKADISGPIGSPKTSTWQIITHLIQNAFIKSILPGFEKEVSPSGK